MRRDRFSRYFFARIGRHPAQYLRIRQLERAKALLATSDLTIDEIAYQACFSDPTTFYRNFRRFFGMTPAQYRRWTRSHASV
jgi:transcriptional regulator GlxA family with amidase domain